MLILRSKQWFYALGLLSPPAAAPALWNIVWWKFHQMNQHFRLSLTQNCPRKLRRKAQQTSDNRNKLNSNCFNMQKFYVLLKLPLAIQTNWARKFSFFVTKFLVIELKPQWKLMITFRSSIHLYSFIVINLLSSSFLVQWTLKVFKDYKFMFIVPVVECFHSSFTNLSSSGTWKHSFPYLCSSSIVQVCQNFLSVKRIYHLNFWLHWLRSSIHCLFFKKFESNLIIEKPQKKIETQTSEEFLLNFLTSLNNLSSEWMERIKVQRSGVKSIFCFHCGKRVSKSTRLLSYFPEILLQGMFLICVWRRRKLGNFLGTC